MSTTCVLLVWRNDKKCKYMFMFSLNNLARKGLILNPYGAEVLVNIKLYLHVL